MLIFDFNKIGNKLHFYRKQAGMTQSEVAEMAGLCDRTYADIERGTVNMRMETVLRICRALQITPDDIFTEDSISLLQRREDIIEELDKCSPEEMRMVLDLVSTYLSTIKNRK